MEYTNMVADGFWVIPLVVAIVQAIKMLGVASKYSPIISIGVGIALGFLINNDFTVSESILSGVIFGLSASGLYSGVKVTQTVADVKSGEIPLEKVNKGLLDEKDLEEIRRNNNQNP